jgi:hypothetical protein
MEDDQPDARPTEAQPVKPKKWWQWVLVYPIFIIVLMDAVPTFKELYDSHSRDVDFGTSKIAEMRNEMWRKNMTCGMAPLDPLINDFNVAVDATICKSGDVLIRVTTPTKKQFFEWVAIDTIFSSITPDVVGVNLFSSAIASELAAQNSGDPEAEIFAQYYGPVVLCQNWISNALFVRRVNYPQ